MKQIENSPVPEYRGYDDFTDGLKQIRIAAKNAITAINTSLENHQRNRDLNSQPEPKSDPTEPTPKIKPTNSVPLRHPSKEPEDSSSELDRSQPNKRNDDKANNQATYDGKSLDELLAILKSERNPKRLGEALLNISRVADQGDPGQIADAVLETLRSFEAQYAQVISSEGKGSEGGQFQGILHYSMFVLRELPSEIVVERILSSLQSDLKLLIMRDFQLSRLSSLTEHPRAVKFRQHMFGRIGELQQILIKSIDDDDERRNWSVQWVYRIAVEFPEAQSSTVRPTFDANLIDPEFVPIIQSVFQSATLDAKYSAAGLLVLLGIDQEAVFELAKAELEERNFEQAIKLLEHLSQKSPEAVTELVNLFEKSWSIVSSQITPDERLISKQVESIHMSLSPRTCDAAGNVVLLAKAFDRIGPKGKPALQILRQIEQHDLSTWYFGVVNMTAGGASGGGNFFLAQPLQNSPEDQIPALRELVHRAIVAIND
ncbi:MAG: hypothetical protein FJ267_02325 [Planctomycetes bacterium]|nr:hypothetical protein [Planctomycetota bacterium]